MAEVLTGYKLLQQMQQGQVIPGMKLSSGANPADFFRGALSVYLHALSICKPCLGYETTMGGHASRRCQLTLGYHSLVAELKPVWAS